MTKFNFRFIPKSGLSLRTKRSCCLYTNLANPTSDSIYEKIGYEPSALAQDSDRLARFEREAKLLATLNHAHIAAAPG